MNLHAVAGPIVASVNPFTPVQVRISVGSQTAGDGSRTPQYAAPGAFTGSIAGNVLTASAVAAGALQTGQLLAGGAVAAGTTITGQLTGAPGGVGTYSVGVGQTLGSTAMTTTAPAPAQVQPVTWRDLQQLEGVNLGGVRWKAYLFGQVDAIVRSERKGGDLIVISTGRHQGTWLVAQILEQFPDWCCCAIVLQNGG
jgi:hypothetical protein